LNDGTASIVPNNIWKKMRARLQAQMKAQSDSTASGNTGSTTGQSAQAGGMPPAMAAAFIGALQGNAEALAAFTSKVAAISKGEVLAGAIEQNPELVVDGFNTATQRGYKKDETQTNLGFRT
jgi:hypothetical protein